MKLNSYYNRYDPVKRYDRSRFLEGRGLQSAELNEIQDYASHITLKALLTLSFVMEMSSEVCPVWSIQTHEKPV